MIQSGKLQQRIEIQRLKETVSPSGAVVETWTTYGAGQSELRHAAMAEFLTSSGVGAVTTAVFMLRWMPGVSVSDRIIHGGKAWNVVAIVELGRRRGLELRVVAA